jgi:galactokinase
MFEQFRQLYGSAESIRVFRAPGRVNLIGEHTDYNLGFVLPVALQLATYVAGAPSADGKLRIYSEARKSMGEWTIPAIAQIHPSGDWTDYPIGVARELIRAGIAVEPANLLIRSTVPEGSGLSSSAALEVASALAFLNRRPMLPLELARLCQRAEHHFAGIPSGIMDQYVALFGHKHSAVELDCRSLEYRLVPLPQGITFVAVNTMIKHALAGSAYQERVRECAQAVEEINVRQISAGYPQVKSLRDVTAAMLDNLPDSLPPVIARRARHVVTENARVARFVDACRRNDVQAMGTLMLESHRSLQQDYEVSCAELDFLVETASGIEGVFGARMTGGGFGGCAVAMVRNETFDKFLTEISRAYSQKFGKVPEVYRCEPSGGAGEMNNSETIPAPR